MPDAVQDPAPEPARPRLGKGERLLIGSGVAYGLGAAVQWATAGATGILGDARPGATSGLTLGMNLGGLTMLQGTILGGFGARTLAHDSRGHDDLAKPLLVGGAAVTVIGGGAMLGTAMFWPTIRKQCPIGAGCGLAGVQLGGLVMSVGTGMLSYGHVLRQRDPDYRSLSKSARTPLIGGAAVLGTGYIMSAALGLAVWQGDPTDEVARRIRNRMLIPVVGPWIYAAGPDAPLPMALVTGGLGALQIGGSIALAVGAGIAGSERSRRRREQERMQVMVVPSFDGVSVVGRF